jgi:hypothetical protein
MNFLAFLALIFLLTQDSFADSYFVEDIFVANYDCDMWLSHLAILR